MYKLQKREQRVHYYIMLAILMHHLSFIAGHIDICNKVPTRSRGLEQAQDATILSTDEIKQQNDTDSFIVKMHIVGHVN